MGSDASKPLRRVVTGVDAAGRSCILFDGPAARTIWSTDSVPADNGGVADTGGETINFPTDGTRFVTVEFPPGDMKRMHATDTIDYLVVISGEAVFITETGETRLRAGDVLVDRGVVHAWRNDTDQTCRIVNVLVPAKPVAKGATVVGDV